MKVGMWAKIVFAVLAGVLAVGAVIAGKWILCAAGVVLAVAAVGDVVREARGDDEAALAEWTPERVREVIGDSEDTYAVMRLRKADRRLRLRDAVALVTQARAD